MTLHWKDNRVLVTGGASFIGAHLTRALVTRGAIVRVVDDLSSGSRAHLEDVLATATIELIEGDLREPGVARTSVRGIETVFHLAADHGGRGYVDLHQAETATNLLLDGMVFREALLAGVERIVFASSGCVYPNHLQTDPGAHVFLEETTVRPPYDSDNMYGYAKLMAELTLRAFAREHGLKTASCRYFTVYGPLAKENHAVLAMIARAFIRQDPFEIWGNGEQIRNWTYVDDVVRGTLLAAEHISDGSAVNLGTMERIRVRDAAEMICGLFNHHPRFQLRPDMPSGPANRVASNALARSLLGWEPAVTFDDGVRRTAAWYSAVRDRHAVGRTLANGGLIARRVSESGE